MKDNMAAMAKRLLLCVVAGFVCTATACGSPSDIRAEIQKYEWTDLYQHKHSYEESCDMIFFVLPARLRNPENYATSLLNDKDFSKDFFALLLNECFIPSYGGKYQNGIPMKNHSYEEIYATTLEVLRTLHKEYIEMGIIEKKK